MKKENGILTQNLIVYSFSHAVTDAISAYVLYSIYRLNLVEYNSFFNLVIIYGLIAFGLQVILGHFCDKLKVPKNFAQVGIFLLLISVFLINPLPIFAIIIVAIGNAFFHIGGGTISLNITPKKATAPGIFVAPGAIGLFLGLLTGKQYSIPLIYPIMLLILTFILILMTREPKIDYNIKPKQKNNIFWIVVILILLSVVIRSFMGFMIVFPWKSNFLLGLIFVIGVVLGKAFGGILGDKFGFLKVGVISLIISAFLLSLGANNPGLGILGIFLFNFSMPITLIVISNMYLGRPGFAFGLTVLALIIGAIPYYAEFKMNDNILYFVFIMTSAIAVYIGIYLYNKYYRD